MGPLSVHKDAAKFKSLDTSAKRDNAGAYTTGKTEHVKRSKGAPVSEENAPKNLARRLRAFNSMKENSAFKRPGSNKK